MSSRKEKLTLLRQQVNKMQTELQILEKCEKEFTPKWNIISHLREVTINRNSREKKDSYERNITKETLSPSEKKKYHGSFTTREYEKQCIQHSLSKTLKDIISKINDDFYIQNKTPPLSSPKCKDKSQFNKTTYVGQRYKYNIYSQRRTQAQRSPQLRTYAFRPTDTILNPERQNVKGLKIVKKIQKSPNNMLTQNPKSNPNLYLFNNTQPVFMQKKANIQDKNKSSIVQSPSTMHMIPSKNANYQEKQRQSQKRHFQRHIQENIGSRYKKLY